MPTDDNPHDRPIRLELSVLADDKAALVHRLRRFADLLEAGRLGDAARGTTGGAGDDADYRLAGFGPAVA